MPLPTYKFRSPSSFLQNRHFIVGAASLMALLSLSACGSDNSENGSMEVPAQPLLEELAPTAGVDAAAQFVDATGTHIGNVILKDGPNGVLLRADIQGLAPGWHGIHLHQVADCSDGENGFKKSGGHIDPDNNAHGLLNPEGYERADIPNIYAGEDGRATAAFFNSYVRLLPGEEAAAAVGVGSILMDENGFAIIIHTAADDHINQPIGGAGGRIACAAIGG